MPTPTTLAKLRYAHLQGLGRPNQGNAITNLHTSDACLMVLDTGGLIYQPHGHAMTYYDDLATLIAAVADLDNDIVIIVDATFEEPNLDEITLLTIGQLREGGTDLIAHYDDLELTPAELIAEHTGRPEVITVPIEETTVRNDIIRRHVVNLDLTAPVGNLFQSGSVHTVRIYKTSGDQTTYRRLDAPQIDEGDDETL